MEPVNWIAVLLAAFLAFCASLAWYGPLFGRAKLEEVGPGKLAARGNPLRTHTITAFALFLAAAMMGHMFARIGADTMHAKPWLYFMMSGGLAVAFVIPALAASYTQMRITTRLAKIDAGFWLAGYLVMGAVFWALG